MLTIIKATEPIAITTLVACIYGPPGVGKTSLASSANTPLLLDFDAGSHRSHFRKDVVRITTWAEMSELTLADLAPYHTIIMDTIGRALDLLSADIITNNSKMGHNGSLTLQGYGELKGRFTQWLKYLRSFGLDVIIVAHSDEKMNGDILTERIDAQGASKNEVYKSADLMGRLAFTNGRRVLNFNPSDISFGKNPINLPVQFVPDLTDAPEYFGSILADTKAGLSEIDAKSSEARDRVESWRRIFEACETDEDFNGIYSKAAATKNKVVSMLLLSESKKRGLKFDKRTKKFEVAA